MIKSPHIEKLEENHQFQGKTNNCGAFSAAIILSTITPKNIDGSQLADDLNKIRWNGVLPVIRRIPNWATFPWGVLDVFKTSGIRTKISLFTKKEKLVQVINSGNIAITVNGGYKPLWAHYKIPVLYSGDQFGFVDPAYSKKQISMQNSDGFYTEWSRYGRIMIEVFPHSVI